MLRGRATEFKRHGATIRFLRARAQWQNANGSRERMALLYGQGPPLLRYHAMWKPVLSMSHWIVRALRTVTRRIVP